MVLVVDDDKDFAKTIKDVLIRSGLECNVAHSAEAALKRLRQDVFDVCFLDLRMPGMGGKGFLERYQEIQPTLKVVVLTGYPSSETMRFALRGEVQALAHDYLDKPVDNDRLIAIAHELTTSLVVDDFRLDTVERQLYYRDTAVHTAPVKYDIIKFLMEHVDQWFTYEEINEKALERPSSLDDAKRQLKTTMWELRNELREAAGYEAVQSKLITIPQPYDNELLTRQAFSFQRKKEMNLGKKE